MKYIKHIHLFILAIAIVGCDSISPDPSIDATSAVVEYDVLPLDGASFATIDIDGVQYANSALPFRKRFEVGDGEQYSISAESDRGSIEVFVAINGTTRSMQRASKVFITGVVSSHDHGELEIEGPIDEVTDDVIQVRGFAFTLTSRTEFEDSSGDSTSIDSFSEGTRVKVEGHVTEDGNLVAREVELEHPEDRPDRAKAEGLIQSLSDGAIVVQTVAFTITEDTRFDDVRPEGLSVGDRVEVEGAFLGDDNTVTAMEVDGDDSGDSDDDGDDSDDSDGDDDDGDDDDGDDDSEDDDSGDSDDDGDDDSGDDDSAETGGFEAEIEGMIDEINDDRIVVRGYSFAITSQTEFENLAEVRVDASEFSEGDRVKVEGSLSDEGFLVAREVEQQAGEDRPDRAETEGLIENLTDHVIVVQSLEFQITASTEFDGVSLDQLSVGNLVEIDGAFLHDDNTITALEIEVEDGSDDDD